MLVITNRDVDESLTDFGASKPFPNRLDPNGLRLAAATRDGRKWRIKVFPNQITGAMAKEVGLRRELYPNTRTTKPIYASRNVAF